MKARKTHRLKKLRSIIRKHAVLLGILLFFSASAGCLIAWHHFAVNAEVARIEAETAQKIKKLEESLKDIKAKRAAAEKAREEAEALDAANQSISMNANSSAINARACNRTSKHADPLSIDVVVNKKHCLQPLAFEPPDLVTSNGATLSAKAIDAYIQLFNAAATAGQPFYTTSSYRSYSTQLATYSHWVSVSGASEADTYSARPGYSEHQTGLAFDVAANGCVLDCFGSTTQYQWLQQHAADYGFIQRYYKGYEAVTGYKAEEWHYRFVGIQVAKDMQAKGAKTLEEYWNISGGSY